MTMTIYRTQPLKLDRAKTYALKSRPSKKSVAGFTRAEKDDCLDSG